MTNIDMLEVLELPAAQVVWADDTGALVQHGELYLLASDPGQEAKFLLLLTGQLAACREPIVVLRSDAARETLERAFGFRTVMECRHAVYPSMERVLYTLPEGATIRKLDARYVDFVHAHYHMVDDLQYIRERIEADMFGVFLGGEIVGFVGTHDERPMGMLEILPQYRRLGLAFCLEAHLINHLLSLGRVAFCQVALVNDASLRLQQKIGMEISERVIYWLARGGMK